MKNVEELRYKRTLFVGLGGAGAKTLRCLKAKIKQAHNNNIPSQIQFLLIDTNATELANYRDFDCSEKICIAVREPYARYKQDHDLKLDTHKFIPSQNVQSLLALERGAGQIRSNGHFAVIENQYSNKLMRIFREKADLLEGIDIDGNTLERDPKVEVRLVFSIAGGTGSGTFLSIATLLRAAIKHCELTAYIYSATHYEKVVENSAKKTVMQNAYAALAELDYMMHFGRNDLKYENVSFYFGPHPNQRIEQTNRPFEEVYYIDRRTNIQTPDTVEFAYGELKRLHENTAWAMHLASTNIISAHTGTIDNVRQKIMEGQFDVGDKFAWISGLGLAEIYLNSVEEDHPDVIKASYQSIIARTSKGVILQKEIIDAISTDFINGGWDEARGEDDGNPILNKFMTCGQIEDGCCDFLNGKGILTDLYFATDKEDGINLNTLLSTQEIGKSLGGDPAKNIVMSLTQSFKENLDSLLISVFDNEHTNLKQIAPALGVSIATIQDILCNIKEKLATSKRQISKEQEVHNKQREEARQLFLDLKKEYDRKNQISDQSLWGRLKESLGRNANNSQNADSTTDIKEKLKQPQKDHLRNDILSKRDGKAIEVFELCISYVDAKMQMFANWSEVLAEVESDALKTWSTELKDVKECAKQQCLTNESSECSKTSNEENRVEVKNAQIDSGYLLKFNDLKNIIEDNNKLHADTQSRFRAIRKLLKVAFGTLQEYFVKGIQELNDMDKSGVPKRTKCQQAIDRLLDLSTPTMQIDGHGYGDRVKVDYFWYIMTDCPDAADTESNCQRPKSAGKLLRDLVEQNTLDSRVNLIHVPGWKDKAILYRVAAAVPPYFVEGVCQGEIGGYTLEGCYEELKKTKCTYTPFSHEMLRQKLEDGITVLKPHDESCDEEVMEHWVNFMYLAAQGISLTEDDEIENYIHVVLEKKTKGCYSIASELVGRNLTTGLDNNTKVTILGRTRTEAYNTFSRYCKTILQEKKAYKLMLEEREDNSQYREILELTAEVYMNTIFGNDSWKRFNMSEDNPEQQLLRKEVAYVNKRHAAYLKSTKDTQKMEEIVNWHNSK